MNTLKFGSDLKPSVFYIQNKSRYAFKESILENRIFAEEGNIKAEIVYSKSKNGFSYTVSLENTGDTPFSPEALGINLGIDTYLDEYPEWNNKYFPTFFRCESTHFWGYFMQPYSNKLIGVYCEEPIAAYGFDYNYIEAQGWGHRIHGAYVSLINSLPLPERHPQNLNELAPKQKLSRVINFVFCNTSDEFTEFISKKGIPVIKADKFTLEAGERLNFNVALNGDYSYDLISPDGLPVTDGTVRENGIYTLKIKTDTGKTAEALFFCRKEWSWYLRQARSEVISKPPHATTHCESWYGFYTGFLAAKHYPDKVQDGIINDMFDEIMPYVYDFDKAVPRLIPERIQNTAALIGILTDRYEANTENIASLKMASRFADWLITRQKNDGGYYRNETLYTCVIYPAKSMLELCKAERKAALKHPQFADAAERHYSSAKKAIDNLVLLLEDIATEGEHTLEDGMISCSCLQLGYLALMLEPQERKPYIEAAEHMLRVHRCLEQSVVPDCRVRGTTVRYWEAQYDITLRHNLTTSPHGWSAWLIYALYYLYLLTGKEEYLIQMMNGLGACVQLLSLEGELRWGFVTDPFIRTSEMLVPDTQAPVRDAYRSVRLDTPAYRGKFINATVGEQYLPMISGWYRTGRMQKVTGGHYDCGLILENEVINVEKQGGCCDNDVHEIFKCLEEVALNQAFIAERKDGTLLFYNCKTTESSNCLTVELGEAVNRLHLNLKDPKNIIIDGKGFNAGAGMSWLELS